MSSLHLNYFFLSTFFLVLSISYTNADLVSDVCSKTEHPSICSQFLRSDPRTKKADLTTLGLITINISTNKAKSVENGLKIVTDPEVNKRYLSCLKDYDDSVTILEGCHGVLMRKDYESLILYSEAAHLKPSTCDDNFRDPPAEPSKLKDDGVKLQTLCSAINVIAHKLSGS